MGEVIEQGILRMPPELWQDTPLDVNQRYSSYLAAADELLRLRELVEKLEMDRRRLDWLERKDSNLREEIDKEMGNDAER